MRKFTIFITLSLLFSFNNYINNKLIVYMSPTCGCCTYWVKHMQENGFLVESIKIKNMDSIKIHNKINPRLVSCHTGIINNYLIEGHVPAKDVKRLLSLKPKIRGLTVPGMPAGSNVPGMEVTNSPAKYNVLSIEYDGNIKIWSKYE